jgi:hypothetical protein
LNLQDRAEFEYWKKFKFEPAHMSVARFYF